MNKILEMKQNEDGSYGIDREQNEINALVKEGNDLVSVFSHVIKKLHMQIICLCRLHRIP